MRLGYVGIVGVNPSVVSIVLGIMGELGLH